MGRKWLHETASPPPRPHASTGYWRFTKHRVTQGRWTGDTSHPAENVVQEMGSGRGLARDDMVRGRWARGSLSLTRIVFSGYRPTHNCVLRLLLELGRGVVAYVP
jgi:hypothetical protein